MIFLIIVLYLIASIVCAAVLMYTDPVGYNPHDEEDKISALLVGLCAWWVLLIVVIVYKVLKHISNLPAFIAGFLKRLKL